MRQSNAEVSAGELRLIFADGSSVPFAVRELVATIRHRKVLALTCLFALLLALPGGAAFSEEVPLWARLVLNLFSVALFTVLYPALLQEAFRAATKRGMRVVYEPCITVFSALITTLAVEALTVFLMGQSVLTRWDLALKLGFGAVFWELHITMMLLFMGPALKEQEAARAKVAEPVPQQPLQVRIGNMQFDPASLLRIETDDHFLIIHTSGATARVLAPMSEVQKRLEPYGLLAHRCHWVAFAELGDIRRQGRSFIMRTASGHEVPVARDRRKAVDEAATERAGA